MKTEWNQQLQVELSALICGWWTVKKPLRTTFKLPWIRPWWEIVGGIPLPPWLTTPGSFHTSQPAAKAWVPPLRPSVLHAHVLRLPSLFQAVRVCSTSGVDMTGRGTQICKTTLAGETGEYFHAQIPTNHGARRGNLLRLLRLSGQTQHASLHRQCQKSPDDVSTVQNRNQISESGDPVAIWGVAIHRLPARIFTASAASLRASRITSCDGDAATLRPMMQGPFSNMIKIW